MNENIQNAWEKYPVALPRDTILAGQYIIKNVLGQGGFGITYLAQDYRTKSKVAIKEFFPETMAMRSTASLEVRPFKDECLNNFRFGMERFLEEAKTLAEFQGNPHIVGVQKYFEENGTAYFVMDYIEGIDFKTYIKQHGGSLPWEDVWRIMSPVMDALESVHKKGLIHRDVTPDNIFISNNGMVKLLDFGSARYSLGSRSQSLDTVLKPGYAPKEQYMRRGKQGPFTDVYSTAACFYAALSGYIPPESLERMEEDKIVPLPWRGIIIDKTIADAISKALEVRSEDRFQTMEKFKQAIMNKGNKFQRMKDPEQTNINKSDKFQTMEETKQADVNKDTGVKSWLGLFAIIFIFVFVWGLALYSSYVDANEYQREWIGTLCGLCVFFILVKVLTPVFGMAVEAIKEFFTNKK